MPYASHEVALARKRVWARENPRVEPRPRAIEAEDENWVVLTCSICSGLFDIPHKRTGRLPNKCDECRGTAAGRAA